MKYILILVATLLSLASHAEITSKEYGTIINLAGRQRKLTQQISKDALLIAFKIKIDQNVVNLGTNSGLFDRTLKGLKYGHPSLGLPPTSEPHIISQLNTVLKLWEVLNSKIKTIMERKMVRIEEIKYIYNNNLKLLEEMDRCVMFYEAEAAKTGLKWKPELATAINLSGRQRMLSQKMTKEYVFVALEYENKSNKKSLSETINLFDQTLKGLQKGDKSLNLSATINPDIQKQLAVVEKIWNEFKPVISEAITSVVNRKEAKLVAKLNLPLLHEMDKAVQMYENESSK